MNGYKNGGKVIMTYEDFIISKRHSESSYGISPIHIPDNMFDFQKHITEKMIIKGRCAGFLDTGLGKTLIELTIAYNYVRHTNKPVLIITPLAVAFQFIKEAETFKIDGVSYSRDGKIKSDIVICNYEMLSKFNPDSFDCVILDESSILKNEEGATRNYIISFLRKVKYRFLFTATPSPNDYIEIGNSSEALGEMGFHDMLGVFFKNNEDTISPMSIGTKWRFKEHGKKHFFNWVKTWSFAMRKPSDMGFSDETHKLPELYINDNCIHSNPLGTLFTEIARTQSEIRKEGSMTITDRVEKAVSLAPINDFCVYWCNLNKESDLIEKLDSDAVQLTGSMKLERKEEILLAFSSGEIKHLVTKPKITCFGLNWQHCNHTIYFPTFSYEEWYQLIRRFYRFGQKRSVTADIVRTEGQSRLIDSLNAKTKKSNELFSMLNAELNSDYIQEKSLFNKKQVLPTWLKIS